MLLQRRGPIPLQTDNHEWPRTVFARRVETVTVGGSARHHALAIGAKLPGKAGQ
jgi:hypothetical protein